MIWYRDRAAASTQIIYAYRLQSYGLYSSGASADTVKLSSIFPLYVDGTSPTSRTLFRLPSSMTTPPPTTRLSLELHVTETFLNGSGPRYPPSNEVLMRNSRPGIAAAAGNTAWRAPVLSFSIFSSRGAFPSRV